MQLEVSDIPSWEAQPKQMEFLTSKEKEVFYGGSAGGGKSDALLIFNILRRLKYPKSRGLIVRKTLAQLEKEGSLIPRSHELLSGRWKWNGQKYTWTAPNKSVLQFGYCSCDSDVYQYQSSQYDDLEFDELTHLSEFQYRYLKSRCRSAKGYPTAIRSASNPGNVGHAWVKKYFILPTNYGQKVHTEFIPHPLTKELIPQARRFVPSNVFDNKILCENDPEYVLFLQSLPENERRALLEGDWDVFKGQFFNEWRDEKHVCKPFDIPKEWTKFITIDWGYAAPLAVLWIALDYNKRAWVYRELYETGLIAPDAAEKIRDMCMKDFPEMTKENVLRGYKMITIDPSVFSKKGEGTESIANSIQKVFKRSLTPAKNQRVNGWMRMREWLSDAPDGKPWMIFFDTCKNAIRTIPEQVYENQEEKKVIKSRIEDLDTSGEDHSADATRYWCVMRPRYPEKDKSDMLDEEQKQTGKVKALLKIKAPNKTVQDFLKGIT